MSRKRNAKKTKPEIHFSGYFLDILHGAMSVSMYDYTFTVRPSNCDCTSDMEMSFLKIPITCDFDAGIQYEK